MKQKKERNKLKEFLELLQLHHSKAKKKKK